MHTDIRYRLRDLPGYLRERGLGVPGFPTILALAVIVGSEAAVFEEQLTYALWGYLFVLLFCVFGPLRFENDAEMLQALALLPVFRLVNLSMPVFFELTLYWLPLVYGPFIPAAYFVAKTRPNSILSMGWLRGLLALPVTVPLGAALGIVEYTLIFPSPLIPVWNRSSLLLFGIVMFVFVALVEELLYRGIVQGVFQERIGRWSGLFVASVLFGIMHSGYGVPRELLFATLVGLLFGLLYDRFRSLLLVVVMHGVVDVFLFGIVPFEPWLVPYLFERLPDMISGYLPV